MNPRKTLALILQGSRNVGFADFVRLVEAFGFRHARTSGSHHHFSRSGIPDALNLQPYHGDAKPWQIRQSSNSLKNTG